MPEETLHSAESDQVLGGYFNYFTEIEEYFVRKRGKNLLVSPLDWCLIELWKDNEIPLAVVLRGIDRAFESVEKRGKSPPRTLFYCHPAILEVWDEHQNALLGTSKAQGAGDEETGPFSSDAILRHIEEIESALNDREGEAFERAIRRLRTLAADLRGSQGFNPERIDRELGGIELTLVDALRSVADRAELKQIEKEVRTETRIYRKRLEKDMYEQLCDSYVRRKLREHYRIPPFSLFSFSDQV